MQFEEISQMVEKSISGLQVDPAACRGQKKGQWNLKIKDANVWIDVFDFQTKPGVYYFQVMSPLCAVPDKRADEFAIDLLEINYNMYGCAMVKKENWYYVLSLRETANLDQPEVDILIDRVAFYSTDYYSKLNFKYQGCWLPKNPEGNKAP